MFGTVAVAIATSEFKHYGFALFLGVPLTMGMLSAFLYQHDRTWQWREVGIITLICMIWSTLALLLCKLEGMICIIMAGTLVASMVFVGVVISWSIGALVRRKKRQNQLHCFALICLPLLMKFESSNPASAPVIEHTTVMDIDATPNEVWKYIPSFSEIKSPPESWLAKHMAYPICCEIDGTGIGATRRCVLSTGVMPEVVSHWEPEKRLEFVVIETPPTMVEQNPFGHVDAEHLDGYFEAQRGRFVLTALPNGRTRVEGTTWFFQNIWPQWYWRPIALNSVSKVHCRVLEHIKFLSERDARDRSK